MKKIANILVLSAVLSGLTFTGCKKGPAEEAGENIDKAMEKTGDAAKDAGEKVKDAVDK